VPYVPGQPSSGYRVLPARYGTPSAKAYSQPVRAALWPRSRRPTPIAGLWITVAAGGFARAAIQIALSWITFEATGSLLTVGVVVAVRYVPQMLLGIPIGIAADWFDRRRLVVGIMFASTATALVAAALAGASLLVVPVIVAIAVLLGILDTLRTTATQAYAYDLVLGSHTARGLAAINLGNRLLGAAGGLAGGYTLVTLGTAPTFVVVGLVLAIGTVVPLLTAEDAVAPGQVTDGAPDRRRGVAARERPSFASASTLLVRNRRVGMLVLTIAVTEILGFTFPTLLPKFSDTIFRTGAAGLGMLVAAGSVGGVASLVWLARFGSSGHSGKLMLLSSAVLGLALFAFAATSDYLLALLWLAVAGAACAVMDTLSQMLLQQCVGERERGAAMGLWVFSIGFAPIGHLALGALADAIGAPLSQALFGATLTVAVGLIALYAPMRRLR
jgi:MFS family permease